MPNRIERKMQQLKEKKEKAFITYMTAGLPDMEGCKSLIRAQEEAGVDVLELGIPFSDPVADGPVIQAASYKSIQQGTSLKKVFALMREVRSEGIEAPILFMMYYNTVFHYGIDAFVADCIQSGVDGLIIPDLPLEEQGELQKALEDMQALEGGAIANPDEQRMVGHYWLRAPKLAPTPEITQEIEQVQAAIWQFAEQVHAGQIVGCKGQPFRNVLVVGIGGSSLGPVFVSEALQSPADRLRLFFIDNTDPDGMDMVLGRLEPELAQTMVIVISKSGGTVETQNGLVEVRHFFEQRGLNFFANAVRITQKGSPFDTAPDAEKWLASFPKRKTLE